VAGVAALASSSGPARIRTGRGGKSEPADPLLPRTVPAAGVPPRCPWLIASVPEGSGYSPGVKQAQAGELPDTAHREQVLAA